MEGMAAGQSHQTVPLFDCFQANGTLLLFIRGTRHFSRGKEATKAFEVGGGGRSSNIPAKASWSQLPESTKNLVRLVPSSYHF